MPALFLSYRRADSADWCERLSHHLALRFGEGIAFRDADSLQPGMRWRQEIDRALRGTQVALVLIGPRWYSPRQRRRLADPKDVLRQEITTVLQRPRCKVVPVLLGGAALPPPQVLPTPLRALCDWQACTLRERQWRRDVEQLVERLRQLLPQLKGVTLDEVKERLSAEQERYFGLLEANPRQALALARSTLRTLDRVCPRYPQDATLQLLRGYGDKNVAMALQRLGQADAAAQALDAAESTFATATRERPTDAGAWNGLGSVAALRGDLAKALRHVDKALKLAPGYPAALQDRRALLDALGRH
jgi:hypothetical protein